MQLIEPSRNVGNINTVSPARFQELDIRYILEEYGLEYKEQDNYLQIGEITPVQGWILHISSIRAQFIPLLKKVIPELILANVPFKVGKSKDIVKYLLDGYLGFTQFGKLLCIYPPENQVLALARKLVQLTSGFRGPAILTDIALGGTVYTRYGSFNPIIRVNENGFPERFIYDASGELISDHCPIPFKMPKDIIWPFEDLAQPVLPMTKKLLNDRYKPLSIIKLDIKGRVIKGIYFKGAFNIKPCLIKEGIKDVWADEYERDIVDRLIWQHELYQDLAEAIPSPKIFDLFQEQNNTYLVMEFIKGITLDQKISSVYNGNSWFDLSTNQKLTLIGFLLKILSSINKLHERGYVHRDITPVNFLLDKKGTIFLIDLELSYSFLHHKPNPSFKLGTAGYMSPEQEQNQVPTAKEDVYALGAMLFMVLVGLPPIKLDVSPAEGMMPHLDFFIESPSIADLIKKCLYSVPEKRPMLSQIKSGLERYHEEVTAHFYTGHNTERDKRADPREIVSLIQNGITGLSNHLSISAINVWESVKEKMDISGIPSVERVPQAGMHTGMTGILYLLALSKRMGFNIDACKDGYDQSWEYLQDQYLHQPYNSLPEGLYDGFAGIAMAIQEGMQSGLLKGEIYKTQMQSCFQVSRSGFSLARGIAGQGTALLRCKQTLTDEFCQPLLDQYICILLEAQQKDGSWNNYREERKHNDNLIGLAYGTAGILCFLINYVQQKKDDKVMASIVKGLRWLQKHASKKRNIYTWTTSTRSKSVDIWGCNMGMPGIALTFIKAYKLLGSALYKEIAENTLRPLPKRPIYIDYTQAFGLAGLGEVYLEATNVLQDEEWQQRTDWIANVFIHTFLSLGEKAGYWPVNVFPDFEADLMTGTSGILHFLMRYLIPDKIGYILLNK